MDRNNLTANRLKHLFHYDGEKGRFTRNISRGGSCAGELAGSTRRDGYVVVRVDYKPYLAHRLSSIRSKGFQHYLGQFETEQEAHNAYLSAKAVLHTFQPVPR